MGTKKLTMTPDVALSTEHATRNARFLVRALLRVCPEAEGTTLGELPIALTLGGMPDKQRFEIWALDSLLFAIVSLDRGDTVMALRCALQAAEYVGRLGGFWPFQCDGAYLTIRNALEDALRPAAERRAS